MVGVGFHWRENTSLLPFVCRLQDGGLSPPGFVPYWSSRLKETVAVSNIVLVHTVTLTTWHHPLPSLPPPPNRPLCSLSAVRVFKVDHFITRARDESKQNVRYIKWFKQQPCRSQWPRGLRRRSTAACLLRSWFRIPPRAWMFVCCECCVLSGTGLCDGLIIRSEESYRLWRVVVCDHETSQERRLKPARGL